MPRVDWRVCVAVGGEGEGGPGHPTRPNSGPGRPKNWGSASLAVAIDKHLLSMFTATLHSPYPGRKLCGCCFRLRASAPSGSMTYLIPDPLPWTALASPLAAAEDALARLDERLGANLGASLLARSVARADDDGAHKQNKRRPFAIAPTSWM